MKVSDYIVEFFHKKNVNTIFGYQGGMVTHIANSIHEHPGMNFVQVYHEQTAAFAAVGYARYTNNLAVAIATSGPGATNLMTGIGDAFFDSVPVIFITGQVNTHEYKYDKPIRQLGFQETNIVDVVKPITKYAKLVDKLEDIPAELEKCYQIATSGRKGPVLLDIPMNIQRELLVNLPYTAKSSDVSLSVDKSAVNEVVELVKKAARPLILIGGGIASANAINEVRKFIQTQQIPFASSLLGKSGCDEYNELYIGTIGSYGNRCANMAIANADLLLVMGARLDVRQTGAVPNKFVVNGNIIHIDIDINELEHSRVKQKINIHADLKDFLNALNTANISTTANQFDGWYSYLDGLKSKYDQASEIKNNIKSPAPYVIIDKLNSISKGYDLFTADVGQNQMWAMQTLKLKPNQRFYTSGGFGSMGSALPISLGIAFAKNNDHTIFSINGDGGTHMSMQSLMLISQYNLPIKVIIINNHALGMITQFQELYFNNVTIGTTSSGGYKVPDFSGIAQAYGLKYFKIDARNNAHFDEKEFAKFAECRNCILEYVVDDNSRVYPKLEFSQPIYNPSPMLSEQELIDNMFVNIK